METTLQITIDCTDPQKLVAFWTQALHYVPEPPPGGHATWREYWADMGVPQAELTEGVGEAPESIVDPKGAGPRVWFQHVPEPKTVKNRVHLDLKVSGGRSVPLALRTERVTAEVERLTAAGARILRTMDEPGMDYFAVVLQDPEGNEFCIA
ncbi:VOC family protein [Streptomyces sp. NPDC006208]|uniref:VOC family protein n=1 Tax=unclassified Streptomyces TaxID=2593676 RepID=UPI002E1E4A20